MISISIGSVAGGAVRKAILSLTLLIMGLETFLIGCLPTFSQLGLWAPTLLVLLRFLQGLGIPPSFHTTEPAVHYSAVQKTPGNRFFISALLQAVLDEPDITWLTAPECPIHHPMP